MKDVSTRSDVIYSPNLFPSHPQISLPSLGSAVLIRIAAFDVTEDLIFSSKLHFTKVLQTLLHARKYIFFPQ